MALLVISCSVVKSPSLPSDPRATCARTDEPADYHGGAQFRRTVKNVASVIAFFNIASGSTFSSPVSR